MEHNKRKLLDHRLTNEQKNSRLRAFSVGAKMPRSDAYRGVIQTAPLSSVQQKRDANLANNNLKSASVLTLSSSHKRTGSGSVIDPMDDLMEIDFTSSPGSSITIEEDVCDAPVIRQYSSSPLAKSQPMSVPAKRFSDEHHHVITGSRGIDPPNGYVPMRPTLHTAGPNTYMMMNPVVSNTYNAPASSAKNSSSMASSPSTASAGRNNNSMTTSVDYLPMSPSQGSKHLSAPEGYMEMGWVKKPNANTPTPRLNPSTMNATTNNNDSSYLRQQQESRPTSMPININQGKSNLNNEQKNINLNFAAKSTNQTTRIRCDSKDSGIMTPSGSHNAIFPFSPGSPNNQQPAFPTVGVNEDSTPARKCLVDATQGTLTLIPEPPEEIEIVDQDESSAMLNSNAAPTTQVECLSSDYADMSLGSTNATKPPAISTSFTTKLSSARTTTNADYTLMHPYPPKKTLLVTINNNLSSATAKTNQSGFRPISNANASATSTASGYELLQVRPNSVNTEKMTPKTLNTEVRPNSAGGDRLLPSNVTPSSSNTTSSSSSTSTLCGGGGGSKSQSPLSVQRVPSNDSNDSQSVQSAPSRPPSVSSERELHYASLDLPPTTSQAAGLELDIALASESRSNSVSTGPDSSASSSSAPVTAESASNQPPAFTYAQIDFIKSEQLKAAAKLAAAAAASAATTPTTQQQPPNSSC